MNESCSLTQNTLFMDIEQDAVVQVPSAQQNLVPKESAILSPIDESGSFRAISTPCMANLPFTNLKQTLAVHGGTCLIIYLAMGSQTLWSHH